ncbi:glycogen synthase [Shewanella inventionis]|uniref:starch synthase n=1 Tax=Shewanella inventionis TaxID=1738770 RepID=A0ABQ1IQT8_9GAMM|nr:glycogen/starch synthase [Shewanella inventionis]MCL1158933.1 glycogen/starch synthase [Shewanella inventionis]GGB48658.1 glycogen synthase [Shewanella inventionis]
MTQENVKRVLLVAAENDALHGAKVGGMADVIRDLPPALAQCGVIADVAMPNYGFLAGHYHAKHYANISVHFSGAEHHIKVFCMPRPAHKDDVLAIHSLPGDHLLPEQLQQNPPMVYLFDHPLFNHNGQVYCNGAHDRPFADDATKFALFSLAVATCLVDNILPRYQVLHLHDWHAAMVAMLRQCVNEFERLNDIACVYTIHNLALQGIRPFSGDESSFAAWFPQYAYQLKAIAKVSIFDPRYDNCINPMRMGIVLSDKVHLVSPSYAKEVLMASNHGKGFFGGEGLEGDLAVKAQQDDLVGIINGCVYDNHQRETKDRDSYIQLLTNAQNAVLSWQANVAHVSAIDSIALNRLSQLSVKLLREDTLQIPFLLTSVGRLTEQKVLILLQPYVDGHGHQQSITVLEALLRTLKKQQSNGVFWLLGSGDKHIAAHLQTIAAKYDNLLFIHGYNESVSDELYQLGDLFLMPSSFEPCGISQMLAMRAGQPCLVHAVGGLKDTIIDNESGWAFTGESLLQQGSALVMRLSEVLALYDTPQWKKVAQKAAQQRFTWDSVAQEYIDKLYG